MWLLLDVLSELSELGRNKDDKKELFKKLVNKKVTLIAFKYLLLKVKSKGN